MASNGVSLGNLKWYYAKLFPIKTMHAWLAYGRPDIDLFAKREVSFTLLGDIYLRFRSFASRDELHAALKERQPIKIDFGAVYNLPPRDRGLFSVPLVPVEKELVFDIDMTDYEDVMAALKGGSPVDETDRNWTYMAVAAQTLDMALREDFGFEHILFVYSGRRGMHCWVADERARALSNEARAAIAEYLALRFDSAENGRKETVPRAFSLPLHPMLQRAKTRILERTFLDFVLNEQRILDEPQALQNVLRLVPDAATADKIQRYLEKNGGRLSPEEKWMYMEKELRTACPGTAEYILFRYTYPRLDINVSKEINHLLKSPFCIHPKTGRVCAPFVARDAYEFAPANAAPTIDQLILEYNERSAKGVDQGIEELYIPDISLHAKSAASSSSMPKQSVHQSATKQFVHSVMILRDFVLGLQSDKYAAMSRQADREDRNAAAFLHGE
ncbi:DNA primase small subunit [Porphyridium purpureum]|uniref:DNA primase n=1 Tax=Porphyridium purpureum TaxID=35688 RepID=A0A5J4Z912_PORPP|nr:DNA primase small subunit [Porphyridium purpureum]|eukprot:POR1453..scf295_1